MKHTDCRKDPENTRRYEAEKANERTETETMKVSSEVSNIEKVPVEKDNDKPDEKQNAELSEKDSGDGMVEMTDPDIQKEAADGREKQRLPGNAGECRGN